MEEAISSIFRVLGSALRSIVQSIIVERIGYSVGWMVSKISTFGRFPSDKPSNSERSKVSYIGLISIVLILLAIAYFNGG
ncbi:hypothetical protein [Vibrio maritimus]|uniref:hypothetical protein n=1 Tax=Vibrio maritimus TaxID=990268 RepID=UPI0037352568